MQSLVAKTSLNTHLNFQTSFRFPSLDHAPSSSEFIQAQKCTFVGAHKTHSPFRLLHPMFP